MVTDRSDDADRPSTLTLLTRAPGYVHKRLRRCVAARRVARELDRRPDHPATDRRRAATSLADADDVVFLCWGNICRSPMAAGYCESHLADRGIDRVRVASAGLGEREGRPSPTDAVAAAAEFGVDLADHRSRALTPERAAADVLFVMDHNDYYDVRTQFPRALDRTYFLGAFVDGGPAIPDPHGEGRERFDRIYGTIASAVESVADAIEGDGRPDTGSHER